MFDKHPKPWMFIEEHSRTPTKIVNAIIDGNGAVVASNYHIDNLDTIWAMYESLAMSEFLIHHEEAGWIVGKAESNSVCAIIFYCTNSKEWEILKFCSSQDVAAQFMRKNSTDQRYYVVPVYGKIQKM